MSVQYTGGYAVHWGISLSTLGDVQYTGGFIEYTGGCSVHWRDIMSTLGVLSTLGVFSTVGDAMSTVGDTMMSVGEYHEYIGGCSVHWDFLTNSIVFPTCIMISPWCTHDIPQCTHDIPTVSMISLSVLSIPHCTAPPGVLQRHYAGWLVTRKAQSCQNFLHLLQILSEKEQTIEAFWL